MLMHLVNEKERWFSGITDEGVDSSVVNLKLSEEAWLDMERPSAITVTIEPGDTLNQDD